jgi:hypothetical protein
MERFEVRRQRIRRKWFIWDHARQRIWGPLGIRAERFDTESRAMQVCAILNDWQSQGVLFEWRPD